MIEGERVKNRVQQLNEIENSKVMKRQNKLKAVTLENNIK